MIDARRPVIDWRAVRLCGGDGAAAAEAARRFAASDVWLPAERAAADRTSPRRRHATDTHTGDPNRAQVSDSGEREAAAQAPT